MTSRRDDNQECFVYITLPGTTEFVTAGRFVLESERTDISVGRFVYGQSCDRTIWRLMGHPLVFPKG